MYPTRVARKIFQRLTAGDFINQKYKSNYSVAPLTSKRDQILLDNRKLLGLCTIKRMAHSESSSVVEGGSGQNRLSLEQSPYLLQHAANPVDWFPWGEEAFEKARAENKLIFLSVGYSTCHWCHVMEKECFENQAVADIMNRYYVNVKVDREERPDVDRMYMSFIHATSGSGGWPMSVFLTPGLRPVTGGTYFPPEDRWGRPGFKTILRSIADQWSADSTSILSAADHILKVLNKASVNPPPDNTDFDIDRCWNKCVTQFTKRYETEFGGFSRAPKFPQPSILNFLFHVYARNKESDLGKQCLEMCLHTLKCMANGGIHDHIANGFARYSTDIKWHVPHFEKMLYDQAQIVSSYCDAYLATKDKFYSDIIHDILSYVERDLSHELGGFYSAEDADSLPEVTSKHKQEGAFCVWEFDEIQHHLTEKINDINYADIFSYHYNVLSEGNVSAQNDPHGELLNKNVLIVLGSEEETAQKFSLNVEQVREILAHCREILREVRLQRPKPHLDSKMVAGWNGLMLGGFARAGFILDHAPYVERAVKAANFIKEFLYDEGSNRLKRCCYRGPNNTIVHNAGGSCGFLDDYAYLVRGLLELAQATQDAAWSDWAARLQDAQDQLFWDTQHHAYFTTPAQQPNLLIRLKDDQDGAEPCGNSVSVHNLLKLSVLVESDNEYANRAEQLLHAYSRTLRSAPHALPEMMSGLLVSHDSPAQLHVTGRAEDERTRALLDVARSHLEPGHVLTLREPAKPDAQPAATVCRRAACSLPAHTPQDFQQLLEQHNIGT